VNEQDVALFMAKTYWWMVLGLVVSAFASYLPVVSIDVFRFLYGSEGTVAVGGIVVAVVMLLMAFIIPKNMDKLSFGGMLALYLFDTAVTGLFLSVIHFVYDPGIIIEAFLITTSIFVVMAIVGTVTKKDLSGIGTLCLMALIGIIIASIVNLFMGSAFLDYAICWIAIVVFMGLIAFDAQKLKEDVNHGENYSVYGALQLYLDFVNVFLYVLRLLAKSKVSDD
jgi:FtsH-binding integral membrane protein